MNAQQHKVVKSHFPARFKILTSETGQPTGEVEFYASIFNNVDLIGDRVKEGAFDASIAEWQSKGSPLPIVFAHNWDDAWAIIGYADPKDISVDKIGLKIKCMLDITTNPYAKQIFSLMLRGIVKEASFAYDVVKEKKADDKANDLLQLDLIEAGPCLKGMNPLAGTISAKALKEVLASMDADADGVFEFSYTIEDGNLKLGDPIAYTKAGARHNAQDMAAIQSVHDALVALGAQCKADRMQPEDIGDPVDNGKSDGIKAVSPSSGEETHVSEEKAAEVEETKTVTPDPADEKAKDTPAADDTDAGDDGDEAAPAKKDVPPEDDEGNDGASEEKAPPAPTDDDDVEKDAKNASDGEDDVDADRDGDAGKPAEPEEEAGRPEKSTEPDEEATRIKAEELAVVQAKAEEYAEQNRKAQVELLGLEQFLLEV